MVMCATLAHLSPVTGPNTMGPGPVLVDEGIARLDGILLLKDRFLPTRKISRLHGMARQLHELFVQVD
jgi:hypothetical protein